MRLRIKYIKVKVNFILFLFRKNYVLVIFLNCYYYFALYGIGEARRKKRSEIRRKVINQVNNIYEL